MSRRIVKKYANRRLYDVSSSRYITQAELKDMIVAGERVQVVDARSGADRTREVLLLIVAEQEQLGRPILSEDLLVSLIRYYGHPLQQTASRYLEISLQQLQAQSLAVARQLQRSAMSRADFMNRLTQSGVDWFTQMQSAMAQAMGARAFGAGDGADQGSAERRSTDRRSTDRRSNDRRSNDLGSADRGSPALASTDPAGAEQKAGTRGSRRNTTETAADTKKKAAGKKTARKKAARKNDLDKAVLTKRS